MHRLLLLLSLGACGGGTALDGPVMCGGQQCDAGEVCTFIYGGIDAGVGGGSGVYYCKEVPSGCAVVDCSHDTCNGCLKELCYPTYTIEVSGRQVMCAGQ